MTEFNHADLRPLEDHELDGVSGGNAWLRDAFMYVLGKAADIVFESGQGRDAICDRGRMCP
jgi:hypothetical protein